MEDHYTVTSVLYLKLYYFQLLEKVIEQCGARAADRERWTRVQRLRENTKQLFLYVIEDANIARMLDTHTIDQIIQHILQQVADTEAADGWSAIAILGILSLTTFQLIILPRT